MKEIRIVFMGTPEFSVPILEMLIASFHVVGVVTQPDKEVGRKRELTPSPIKKVALAHQIPVLQPTKIRTDYESVLELAPDIIITCAYGQLIPRALLDAPRLGCVNVHASLLPSLRGGAPIHHAILDGYQTTGITIMYMVEKMDAGDILFQKEIPILEEDTVGSLHDKLSLLGAELLASSLPMIIEGKASPISQDESLVTYGYNIKREEEFVTFDRSTEVIYNHIRGLNSFPGAYGLLDGAVVKLFLSRKIDKVWEKAIPGQIVAVYPDGFGVATLDGEIVITEIQLSGKKRMLVRDYFHGMDATTLIGKIFKGV